MNQIPPEIDELMWGIAENDSAEAVYAFETRYPNYQAELLRRIKTVKALKVQGKSPAVGVAIPKFQARPAKPDSRPLVLIGVGTIALSIGIIATSLSLRPRPLPAVPAPTIVVETPKRESIPQVEPQAVPSVVNPSIEAAERIREKQAALPAAKLFDLQLSGAKLHDVIRLIGEGGEVAISIAPGLENPDIEVAYTQMTAMEMLKSLGNDYAFSAVIDGERSILVIPVKEVVTENDGSNEVR